MCTTSKVSSSSSNAATVNSIPQYLLYSSHHYQLSVTTGILQQYPGHWPGRQILFRRYIGNLKIFLQLKAQRLLDGALLIGESFQPRPSF